MRVLVHDFAGHPFQVELSRELARRGHDVTHSYCPAWVSGKGNFEGSERLLIEPVGPTEPIEKDQFVKRLLVELVLGWQLLRQVRRTRADVAMMSNAQIPTLVVFAIGMLLLRKPWVLWHQDVYAVAIKSFAGEKLGRGFRLVATVFTVAERWVSRRAAAVVVIADSFVAVHEEWGTAEKTTVIPNWAPLDEIFPVDRLNAWSGEQGLDEVRTLLYSGTLGLKHNPELLVGLAAAVRDAGTPVQLVVVNQGAAEAVLRAEAERLDVPLMLLPFQPYERLPEVLGSGDVLVVLLEQDAGAFSVPSKTLSYLCAGRPIVGFMPAENLASQLVGDVDGCVLPPNADSLPAAATWVAGVLADREEQARLGKQARALAEREFALEGCADRFETILTTVSS
ncbi:glycosyltransferase WbuB [Nocardioides marmoriginsengisoli]|uniref:Glycosyltransferase WbuB n=1 Tax=Nocardioides marmoriginsengisoli TaxID=661483 RepID=A0A3N0CS28_9ACTN|nr:glycosyltransferase family 4 protein [Nocardioides marmoriginsengisoli]RNL66081.1 glycosyltransferase WbuB [Nocardioides marmoriginsengisoli]